MMKNEVNRALCRAKTKLFFKLSMLLFVLAMSTNVVWGQEQKIYFASLKAQSSPESTGSGQVKLTWLDIKGKPMTVKLAKDLNCAAFGTNPADQTTYDMSHWSESNGPADVAQMIGGTLLAMDGMEIPMEMRDQIYTTSFLYFHAEGFPAEGSYLAGWTFTDPMITRMTSSMNPGDPMGNGSDIPYRTPCFKVLPDTANNAIFPTDEVEKPTEPQQGDYESQEEYQQAMDTYTQDMEAYVAYVTKQVAMIAKAQDVVQNKYNNLYAVFAKYLLSNPNATGALVATTGGATAELQLTFDVEGDVTQFKENYADFQFPSYPHSVCVAMSLAEEPFAQDEYGAWTWDFAETPVEFLSATKARAHIKIIYTAKAGITEGEHTTTLTVAMKGTNPSTLNIPLTVMARPANSKDASVKVVGETTTTTEYETLAGAVTAANAASGDVTLTLLHDVAVSSTVTLTNTMTLDLNGYTLSAASAADKGMADKAVVTIDASGKTVTLAYNKLGGSIEAAPRVKLAVVNGVGVEVKAGTLVLNGGTISAQNLIPAYQWNEAIAGVYWQTAPYEFASIQSMAVKVASGATLVQNGATITATSDGPNAYGIVNNGTVTINQGTISAEAQYNGAMAVNAMSGSTTTVNGGSLSALVHEVSGTVTFNPAVPAGLSTWSNVYGVYVGAGSTVTLYGGELYAESTGASRAFGVGALANFGGTLTINKGATMRAKSPNTTESFPLAIMAAGSVHGAVTINGGKFDGWFKSPQTGNDTINPAVFGLDYTDVTFKSGICKTDKFFMKHPGFASSAYYPANTLFNVVKGGKDYVDGYRYIAVADPATQNDRIAAGVPACRIGTVGYTKLEDALAYANNNPNEELVIFMMNDYTLPAGYYTLPAKATLVVPMSDEQAKEVNVTAPRHVFNDVTDEETTHYIEPTEFRRLTFANGVNMEVFGDIELTCTQFASNEAYTGQPYGPYGRLVMEEGSKMTLQSGSELRAWGYMTGAGETDVRRGATVREMFQLGDWKGAFTSVKIVGMAAGDEQLLNMVGDDSDKKIFPVTQYFIQNIESPVKYHPGALLTTTATVSEGLMGMSVSMAATDIAIVGVSGQHQAIFLMDIAADAENTWVRKWYDAEHDIQVYDVNSAAHIGSMVLDMGEMNLMGFKVPVKLNSAKFDLPITCNMKIHLFSGSMDFKQNTCLLPGAEVQVDKESTVSVAMSASEQQTYNQWKADHAAWVKGGRVGDEPQKPVLFTGALYVYDKEDWGQYAYRNEVGVIYDEDNPQAAYTKTVRYTPSANNGEGGRPEVRDEMTCPEDAAINVRGTFTTATGFVYTSEHGANIFSNNADAGTFIFNEDAANADNPREVNQVKVSGSGMLGRNTSYETINFYPARLKHGDGTYENTDVAKEGDAYCYKDNVWFIMKVDEDNSCFMRDNRGTYYAKPQDYVAVVAKKQFKKDGDDLVVDNDGNPVYEIVGNADHTYSDKAGTGRLFILMEDQCQWWEVEKEDNLYHCIHPENDTYYYWDESAEMWKEKMFTITWRNWNGDIVQTADQDGNLQDSYEMKYGTQAVFLGTNPTRESDIDYTYDFTGWSPTPGRVTNDVTYTATYQAKDRMYTITFLQEGGSEIERQFLKHNDVPVCKNTPTKVGHTLVWSPAIAAVTGDATYTATWLENPPTEYEVTFFDYDGTTELQKTNVDVGDMPEYNGATPTGKATWAEEQDNKEFTYVFDHWSPALEEVSATSIKSYTAVYREVAQTYKVRFYQADGTTQIGDDQNLAYGAMPIAPASNLVTEPEEEGYTYTYVWQNKADASKTVETVKDAADYKAVFTGTKNKYKVTLRCATPGGCTFTGAGIYEHGTSVTIAAIPNRGYEFEKWQETESQDAALAPQNITADITLTAVVKEVDIPDPTNLTVGINETKTIESATDYANLTITSDGLENSSQIINADNIDLLGNADFILKREFKAGMWYCVAVPWRVEANGGVFLGHSGTPAVLGKDYEVCYYDGETRAAQGKVDACWVYMKNVSKKILEPGRAYMFFIKHGVLDQVIFRKKAYESILTEVTIVHSYTLLTGDSKDGGWNGIANPSLYHAYINAGSADAKAQRYLPDEERYDWFELSAHQLVVGEPIYVQAPSQKTIIANNDSYSGAPARRANANEVTPKYNVSITPSGMAKYADHLSVRLNEDKEENNYVIGQDLTKFGVSSKVAQMWINRYDAKLCVNAVAPEGEATNFPMSIFAPKAGTYTIALENESNSDDYALYLTYNGEAIWNLSDGAYTANLEKGTDANYGLRISIKKAPEVVTGIDEAIVDSKEATATKVLLNGQVFIIRGERVYSIDGQLVK